MSITTQQARGGGPACPCIVIFWIVILLLITSFFINMCTIEILPLWIHPYWNMTLSWSLIRNASGSLTLKRMKEKSASFYLRIINTSFFYEIFRFMKVLQSLFHGYWRAIGQRWLHGSFEWQAVHRSWGHCTVHCVEGGGRIKTWWATQCVL